MSATRDVLSIEYYNSVGGAAFTRRLLGEWEGRGARVAFHCAVSETAYRANRGRLGRFVLRWRMYAGYAWTCWRRARKDRNLSPVRVVTTNPFFAPALVAYAGRGHGATVNLLYDLYPEALIQAGKIEAGSWVAARCSAITRHALRECAATVFLGDRLRAYAEATYGAARRAVVIPVGADGSPFKSSPPRLLRPAVRPRILYSGLMGSMHDSQTIAAALTDTRPAAVTWGFNASGVGYARLRETAGLTAEVTWGGALPDPEWQRSMRRAQVALVTICPAAERVVMPSKTYSALVAGQAVLAICRRASDLADLVTRHDCGWIVEPGDVSGLRNTLAQIAGNPGELWAKRRRAFEAGHRFYDMGVVASAWAALFEEIAARGPAQTPGDNPRVTEPRGVERQEAR